MGVWMSAGDVGLGYSKYLAETGQGKKIKQTTNTGVGFTVIFHTSKEHRSDALSMDDVINCHEVVDLTCGS